MHRAILMILIIFLFVNIPCFSEPVAKTGNLLVKSSPIAIQCELSFGDKLQKDKINIKGGVFTQYTLDKWEEITPTTEGKKQYAFTAYPAWSIKKVDDILYISSIPVGECNIAFWISGKGIINKTIIQDGKTCLINTSFSVMGKNRGSRAC